MPSHFPISMDHTLENGHLADLYTEESSMEMEDLTTVDACRQMYAVVNWEQSKYRSRNSKSNSMYRIPLIDDCDITNDDSSSKDMINSGFLVRIIKSS